MGRAIRSVVVLGANGAMGSGSGAVFAAAGIPTVFLARTTEKAEAGRARAESKVKSTSISRFITTGSYDADLERVFRSLCETGAVLHAKHPDVMADTRARERSGWAV